MLAKTWSYRYAKSMNCHNLFRWGFGCTPSALSAALILWLTSIAGASAIVSIGAGPGVTGGDIDLGTPTNVDRTNPQELTAGTYQVTQFDVRVGNTNGSYGLQPFLATGTPADYTVVWVGPVFTPSSDGVFTVEYTAPVQSFTLPSDATVFAGTDSIGGSILVFTDGGSTSHNSGSSLGPIFVGQQLDTFTNPDLDRTYHFSLSVDAIPEPASEALLAGVLCVFLVAPRRRRV